MIALAIDALVCLVVLATAVAAVAGRDLLTGIVFFLALGIALAIAWVRLDAVDLALAEAAIGTGLTGVLLMTAWARLRRIPVATRDEGAGPLHAVAAVAAAVLAVLVGRAVLALDPAAPGLADAVADGLAVTGIGNPVTAVLLDYRAFDTLLETIVLVAALACVWAATEERHWGGLPGARQRVLPAGTLATYARALPQFGVVVGLYLVWVGTDRPGGAFQGGTVLAATWLLALLGGLLEPPRIAGRGVRVALVAGPVVFLAFGIAGALAGDFLALPAGWAKTAVLVIELALAASIATVLALAVLGPPERAAP